MADDGSNITIFGQPDPRAVHQLARCLEAEEGARGVLRADAHVGYSQPIGGAVAYRDHISPSGVGYDISCGCKATRTDLRVEDVKGSMPGIADEIARRISFGMGRVNDEPVDHPVLDRIRTAPFAPQRTLADLAGQQPVAAAQAGFVGSTMGEASVILEGTENAERALFSTVHGAGRLMSRTQARGKWKRGRQIKPGAIDFERVKDKLAKQGIELRGGDADEAPRAYKRLDEVLAFHGDTIEVTQRLEPLAVVMAGPDVFDPFKD